jgi:hypothetical protein
MDCDMMWHTVTLHNAEDYVSSFFFGIFGGFPSWPTPGPGDPERVNMISAVIFRTFCFIPITSYGSPQNRVSPKLWEGRSPWPRGFHQAAEVLFSADHEGRPREIGMEIPLLCLRCSGVKHTLTKKKPWGSFGLCTKRRLNAMFEEQLQSYPLVN